MAETVTPAVRGVNKVSITFLQIGLGLLPAALVGGAARFVLAHMGVRPSFALVAGVCLLAGLADMSNQLWRHPRPLAVHRQVPRHWGHEHGPWKAAIRYSLRLGVGPATMLNTWTWWAALFVCAATGPGASVAGAAVFVAVRFSASAVSTLGVETGVMMAVRSKRLDAVQRPVVVMTVAVALGLALVGFLGAAGR